MERWPVGLDLLHAASRQTVRGACPLYWEASTILLERRGLLVYDNVPVSEYRRIDAPGATVFFTVVTHRRRPILTSPVAVDLLRAAFRQTMQHDSFAIDAIAVLPDHVHTIWTLPDGDGRFARRWSAIKSAFTRAFLAAGGPEASRSGSRRARGERGVWQRRFWEHVIRDDDDFGRHVDYIHYNPVKHGLVRCPHAWPHSSFHRHVREGTYPGDWMCVCTGRRPSPPDFGALADRVGE